MLQNISAGKKKKQREKKGRAGRVVDRELVVARTGCAELGLVREDVPIVFLGGNGMAAGDAGLPFCDTGHCGEKKCSVFLQV